jgi:hypothetical protein
MYILSVTFEYFREHCLEIDNDVFVKDALEQEQVEDRLSQMKEKLSAMECAGKLAFCSPIQNVISVPSLTLWCQGCGLVLF